MANVTSPVAKKERRFRGIVVVNRESCKGCGFCVEFCPLDALALEQQYNAKGYHPPYLAKPELCNGCDMCGLFCPDFSIFGYRETLDAAATAAAA